MRSRSPEVLIDNTIDLHTRIYVVPRERGHLIISIAQLDFSQSLNKLAQISFEPL